MEERAETIIVSKCMEFRIKPTIEQRILIWKTFGCCRFVWNHLLDERISYEKVNKGKLLNTTPAHLKKENPFLCEVDSMALINTQLNLNQACMKLYPKGKAVRDGTKQPTVAGTFSHEIGRDLKPESRRHDQPTVNQFSYLFSCPSL